MNYYKTSADTTGTISFTMSTEKDQNVYLFVESSGIEDVLISVGYEQYSQNTSREYVYDLGVCKAGTPITVEMTVKDDINSASLNFFAYALDDEKFEEGYEKLNSGALNIDSFTDTEITGTLNASEDGIIYTSIPYDDGWKITLDGKEVAKDDIVAIGDALLGVKVSAGNHSVKFKYTPRGMMLGLGISAVTALILIAVAVLLKKRKDNRPQPVLAASENVAADTASSDTAEADSACSSDIAATDESKADESDKTE